MSRRANRANPRSRSDTACPACALAAGPRQGDAGAIFLQGFAEGVRMAIVRQAPAALCPGHQKILDDALESRGLVFEPTTVLTH